MTELEDRAPSRVTLPEIVASGRGRPAAVRRNIRRKLFLDAAGSAFAARGYHAATMDEIAQWAGFSKPVLYQHFSSKLELYLAVLQHHLDALVSSVRRALGSTGGNQRRLRAAVQAYFDFVDREVAGFRLVFESSVADEPSVQWHIDRAEEECVDAVFDLVARGTGLDPRQARVLAVGLIGASRFAARDWLEASRPLPKEMAVEMTVALCWGGLSQVPLQTPC